MARCGTLHSSENAATSWGVMRVLEGVDMELIHEGSKANGRDFGVPVRSVRGCLLVRRASRSFRDCRWQMDKNWMDARAGVRSVLAMVSEVRVRQALTGLSDFALPTGLMLEYDAVNLSVTVIRFIRP